MENPYFDVAHFLKRLEQNHIVEELMFLRSERKRLAEIKIDQRSFKYLKKLGVYSCFLHSDEKKWLAFNFTEQVLLRISETFWSYGFEAEMIKSIVEVLMSDNWVIEYINESLLINKLSSENLHDRKDQCISFLEYCLLEKQQSPNLRSFTNLEALIIAAFSSNTSLSIVVNQNGEWCVYSPSSDNSASSFSFKEDMFNHTFMNITFKGLLDELITPKRQHSPILNPNLSGRKNLDSLISKGFDYKEVRDLEMGTTKINTELIELPTTTNIGKLKASYANHDILIKVRNSKVSSVKQLIIKKS